MATTVNRHTLLKTLPSHKLRIREVMIWWERRECATKFACATDLTLSAKNKSIRTVTDLTLARFRLGKQCCLYLWDLSDTVSVCLCYRPPTELWEGNVFSCVCLSMWPLLIMHWASGPSSPSSVPPPDMEHGGQWNNFLSAGFLQLSKKSLENLLSSGNKNQSRHAKQNRTMKLSLDTITA